MPEWIHDLSVVVVRAGQFAADRHYPVFSVELADVRLEQLARAYRTWYARRLQELAGISHAG